MVQNAGASPVWGLIAGRLITIGEGRSATGQFFTVHMSDLIVNAGPQRDSFFSELAQGRISGVLAIGLSRKMLVEINQHGVPVVGFCGAGNHVVLPSIHEQVEAATAMLIDAGCQRIEFWTRATKPPPPLPFSVYDIIHPPRLIARFRDPKDAPAQQILRWVSTETARQITACSVAAATSFETRHWLCDTINIAGSQPSLWDEATFADVKLSESTVAALAAGTDSETALRTANRLLIQDTFNIELQQSPDSELDAVNAFQSAVSRYLPDGAARVRYAGRSDVGDVGDQMPSYNLACAVFGTPGSRPDGVILDDDMAASGVHKALEELGIKIGVDVKIATHANAGSPIGFALHGRVIQMMFDPTDFVEAMFEILDHDSVNDLERMRIVHVMPRLVSPLRR